jgi:signal transduction histidine kinase
MSKALEKKSKENHSLPKAPTGIQGLDEITRAGFRGRPTLICRSGVGLGGMRERLRQLGGTLEIKSGDSGTEVTATLLVE